jgi:hypothetical protein
VRRVETYAFEQWNYWSEEYDEEDWWNEDDDSYMCDLTGTAEDDGAARRVEEDELESQSALVFTIEDEEMDQEAAEDIFVDFDDGIFTLAEQIANDVTGIFPEVDGGGSEVDGGGSEVDGGGSEVVTGIRVDMKPAPEVGKPNRVCGSEISRCPDPQTSSSDEGIRAVIHEVNEDEEGVHEQVRGVRAPESGEMEEVILDSGADVTVIPLRFAHKGSETSETTTLRDAQGGKIPGGNLRTVIFEARGENGERLFFRDRAAVAQVRQPLLCVGKLFREQWLPASHEGQWFMEKQGYKVKRFPVRWTRNSLATKMYIRRAQEEDENAVRMVVELTEEMNGDLKTEGWQMTTGGEPLHLCSSSSTTIDPSRDFPSKYWPFRSTLVETEVPGKFEIFEAGEFWQGREVLDMSVGSRKVVTVLHLQPIDPHVLGNEVQAGVFAQSAPECLQVPPGVRERDEGHAPQAAAD